MWRESLAYTAAAHALASSRYRAFLLSCVGLFCLFELLPWLEPWFALWPLQTGFFLPWQLLTYAFLHGSFTHLLMNMLGLWMFGSELERVWGTKRYIRFWWPAP